SAVESAVSVTQTFRSWFDCGSPVFGSIAANSGFEVPPPGSSCDFGVPGFAWYWPICEYTYPPVASSAWMRMYWAKHRALDPLSMGSFATLHVGRSTPVSPASLTSLAIADGVMSGVPTIFSCLRLSVTVERPFSARTIATTPNATNTAPAANPPHSRTRGIQSLLLPARPLVACVDFSSAIVLMVLPVGLRLRPEHRTAIASRHRVGSPPGVVGQPGPGKERRETGRGARGGGGSAGVPLAIPERFSAPGARPLSRERCRHALEADVHDAPEEAGVERPAVAKAPWHREAEQLLPRPPRDRGADSVGAARIRANLNRPGRIFGPPKRHLSERGLVELLHHAHAHGVEGRGRLAARDLRGDVRGRCVCLEKREERLLDREVARVADGEDVRVSRKAPAFRLGDEEASLVGLEPGEARARDVGRECDQQVIGELGAGRIANRSVKDALGDVAAVAVDSAAGELGLDYLVEPRPERLDVTVLVRGPGDLGCRPHALSAQPRVEHEGDLVERSGAFVVRGNQEEDSPPLAPPTRFDEACERLAQAQHVRRGPRADGVFGEARDLGCAHPRARRDHQEVVRDRSPVSMNEAPVRVDLPGPGTEQLDSPSASRAGKGDREASRVEPEWDVDGVRLEQEVVLVREQRDPGTITGERANTERRLEPAEAAPEHDHSRPCPSRTRITGGIHGRKLSRRPARGIRGDHQSQLRQRRCPRAGPPDRSRGLRASAPPHREGSRRPPGARSRTRRGTGSAQHPPDAGGDLDVLARRDHDRGYLRAVALDATVARGSSIALRVELYTQESEAFACQAANLGRVLADTAGEGERVEASQGRRHRRDASAQAVTVDVERVLGLRVPTAGSVENLAHVGGAGEAGEAGLVLERRRHLPFPDRRPLEQP